MSLMDEVRNIVANRVSADDRYAVFAALAELERSALIGTPFVERPFMAEFYTIEHEKLAQAQYEAWAQVRKYAVRAHQICNLLRASNPDVAELGDDGCLHEAIHDLMRVQWPTESPRGVDGCAIGSSENRP